MPVDRLFVYGSLLRGLAHSYSTLLISQSTFVGTGSFPGNLYDLGNYPGATYDARSSGRVLGELYQMKDPAGLLPILDEYEGITGRSDSLDEFRRVIVTIEIHSSTYDSWVYLYNLNTVGKPLIKSGDYGRFRTGH